ncbi:MAG: hypothetical protein EXR47_07225 [Dehalococcoidia bacterium]|nr:hypothetical protein [Dehalococcoidia bacterium]
MHSIVPQYLVELTAFIQEFLEERPDALLLLQEAGASTKDLQEEARAKADLFGNESLERFLGALESFQGFSEMVVRAVAQGGLGIQRLLTIEAAAGHELLRAAVCIMTVTEVLRENVRGWRRESLSLLAAAADDAMTEVEDAAVRLLPGALMDLRRLRGQLTQADMAAIDRAMSHLGNNPFPTPTMPPELIKQIGDYWRYLVSPNLRLAYRVVNCEVWIFRIGLHTDFYNDL